VSGSYPKVAWPSLVEAADIERVPALRRLPWVLDTMTGKMITELSPELEQMLDNHKIAKVVETSSAPRVPFDRRRFDQFAAVRRWFQHDWMRIEPKLRTSITEGISVFLSLFDDNPSVKYTFCPPKECYDPVANADGRYGVPMPPFAELIESGRLVALNFPVVANPGLARMIGTLMKQDFQRAVLSRIPLMAQDPQRRWRNVLFLCDEYHAFATVGEHDPTGDEKFFALSRQARCVPIVATQSLSSLRSALPGESWRTLLQTFRTRIFLALSDDFSARIASELCGRDERLTPQYTISENAQDAGVSLLGGRTTSRRSTITASKTYQISRQPVFEAQDVRRTPERTGDRARL
jgi:TraM recognition site of TraD and TraG